jgi:hypothetical protein
MLVFRIEDTNGIGPYHSQYCHNVLSLGFIKNLNKKVPTADFSKENLSSVNGQASKFYYAFQSKDDLLKWFHPQECCYNTFEEWNFRVCVYKVNKKDVIIGGTQVAFRRKNKKPIRKINPRTFLWELKNETRK